MTELEKLYSIIENSHYRLGIENRRRQARVVFDIKYRMGDELGINA